jgi:predicted Zn finger-like uncharacterized protein
LADTDQRYNFICPKCSGSFSIQIERIPPVQARFRCPHCKEPMDFPSREEARAYVRLQAETASVTSPMAAASLPAGNVGAIASPAAPPRTAARPARETPILGDGTGEGQATRFRIEKAGFQSDVFDRRGLRNLIRTGEVVKTDRVRVDDSAPVSAGDLPYLISLFKMAEEQRVRPPACCRTHTEQVAFFKCNDTNRPLCEKCAPEKKFGGQTIRVCQHCGGTATDLVATGA